MSTSTTNSAPDDEPPARIPKASEIKSIRPDLPGRIDDYKAAHGISDADFAKLVGANSTQISRARSGKFVGNVALFEAKLDDFFKGEETRREASDDLFQNAFTDRVGHFLDTVRRTQDIGLGFSDAGKGKTSGIARFLLANPTAVLVTMSEWNGRAGGLQRLLWCTIDARGWDGYSARADYLVERFKGSRRLFILDNAHRMKASCRKWMFDFHDATGCPFALVGNPEILVEIRRNDQQFSRIGHKEEFKSADTPAEMLANLRSDVAKLVALHWPEAEGQLGTLPDQVISKRGHSRALKKQLLLARDLFASSVFESPQDAFRAAHTKLVRDYALV